MQPAAGPTILGIDVLWVATLLSGVAALAVVFALYMATTVRDPMAKRVKALNERREQLKAGIMASTSKRRTKITHKNETTDRLRGVLSSLRRLVQEGATHIGVATDHVAQRVARARRLPVGGRGLRQRARGRGRDDVGALSEVVGRHAAPRR